PFMFTATFTILKNTSETYFSQIQSLFSNVVKVDAANWNNFKNYLLFIIYMLIIMAIIVALLNLFDDIREDFRLAVLFFTGLLSRVVLGFSPTLYASGMRTFIFFDALLIFSIVQMYDCSEGVRCKLSGQTQKIASFIFTVMVVLSIINNAIAICGVM
ncbi:MAG: hypothetical protein LUH14_00975, partial [Clostridiaceae bacterium]|nr:hypothetical protein [Clostridiaceae bacterium]